MFALQNAPLRHILATLFTQQLTDQTDNKNFIFTHNKALCVLDLRGVLKHIEKHTHTHTYTHTHTLITNIINDLMRNPHLAVKQ